MDLAEVAIGSGPGRVETRRGTSSVAQLRYRTRFNKANRELARQHLHLLLAIAAVEGRVGELGGAAVLAESIYCFLVDLHKGVLGQLVLQFQVQVVQDQFRLLLRHIKRHCSAQVRQLERLLVERRDLHVSRARSLVHCWLLHRALVLVLHIVNSGYGRDFAWRHRMLLPRSFRLHHHRGCSQARSFRSEPRVERHG